MHINREDGLMIMTQELVCTNHGNREHFNNTFVKLNDHEYKCSCGVVMRITRTPILIIDKHGRLKIQVVAEPKNSQTDF
jgi:hypothetical protein